MFLSRVVDRLRRNERLRRLPFWCRIVMERSIQEELARLPLSTLDALEVSGDNRGHLPFRTYRSTSYPEFDLCADLVPDPRADVVFCEQVLEHLPNPWRAAANLRELVRPGGLAIVSVPFLIRIHREPGDYWRFSEDGLRTLLEGSGFIVERTGSWGNRLALLANTWVWIPYMRYVMPMHNDETTPLIVWAFARRPAARVGGD
jgi:SAM-dependent methyltransferase